MRALILSDSHGDEFNLRWMLEQVWKYTGPIDHYIHLGDGAADFMLLENFIRTRDLMSIRTGVAGNCDFGMYDLPKAQVIPFGKQQLFLTHGHLYHVKDYLAELEDAAHERGCGIALYGHTHRQKIDEGRVLMVNPGCARSGECAILEEDRNGQPKVKLIQM